MTRQAGIFFFSDVIEEAFRAPNGTFSFPLQIYVFFFFFFQLDQVSSPPSWVLFLPLWFRNPPLFPPLQPVFFLLRGKPFLFASAFLQKTGPFFFFLFDLDPFFKYFRNWKFFNAPPPHRFCGCRPGLKRYIPGDGFCLCASVFLGKTFLFFPFSGPKGFPPFRMM